MPTQVLSIPLASSGPGPSVDVSAMVGPKTVQLTGMFRGAYVVYGSHDGAHFAPLFQFDAGGVEGLRRTFSGALARVRVVSLASGASGVTASISGVVTVLGGDNHFAVLSVLAPGARGPQPALDLGLTDYVSDLNFIAQGGLSGPVVVEGSLDGVRWNPIGEFSVGSSGSSLLAPAPVEFGPLGTDDLVRYVRVDVLGEVTSTMTVTVGGSKDPSGGAGTSETLAQAYDVGSSPADQTLVLEDARGGAFVVDGGDVGFTGRVVFPVKGTYGDVAFQVIRDGSLEVGSHYGSGIMLGEVGFGASVPQSGCVAVGLSALVASNYDPRGVAVGMEAVSGAPFAVAIGGSDWVTFRVTSAVGQYDVVVGSGAQSSDSLVAGGAVLVGGDASGDSRSVVLGVGARGSTDTVVAGSFAAADSPYSVVLGSGASSSSSSNYSVVVGPGAGCDGTGCVVVGLSSQATGDYVVCMGVGSSAAGGNSNIVIGINASSLGDSATVVGGDGVSRGDRNTVIGKAASVVLNLSGSFLSAADSAFNPGVTTTLTASGSLPVRLQNGQQVTISDSGFYDGTWTVSNVDLIGGTFDISTLFTSNDSGNWLVVVSVNNATAVGFSATVLGNDAIAMGQTHANYDGDVVIGLNSSTSAASSLVPGNNVVIGRGSSAADDSNVVIGDSCSSSSVGLSTPTGNNVVVGNGSNVYGAVNISIGSGTHVGTNIYPVSYGVGLGFECDVGENYGVAVGYQAVVAPLAVGSVVVGNAIVGGPQSVVLGDGASSGVGLGNVAIGKISYVGGTGDANTCVGFNSQIGDYPVETRDFHNNVRVGSGNAIYGNTSISVGNNSVVGDTTDLVPVEYCISLGSGATTRYSYSVAIGFDAATTESNQVVFGSSADAFGAIHEFAVRGFSATGACDTLLATDAPADGSTGLTVVFNAGGTFSNKTLKAATLASIGPTKLVAYFDP